MVATSSQKVYFISGASRGLGLGLVAGLMKQDSNAVVVAAARNPDKSEALQALVKQYPERIHTVVLDTGDEASVKAAAASVAKLCPDGIDTLINMAGVMDSKIAPALETEGSDYLRVLKINTVGPFLVTQALYPLLKKRETRTIVNVSSGLGSITLARAGHFPLAGTIPSYTSSKAALNMRARPGAALGMLIRVYGGCLISIGAGHFPLAGPIPSYTSSKAALNMQTAVLANALKDEGFTIIATCPGWVATDMGSGSNDAMGATPDLTVEQSTERHLKLIGKLTKEDNGKYFSAAEDKELPY